MRRLLFALALLVCLPARADLAGYVSRPDAAYAWSLLKNDASGDGTVYRLSLVSQTWRGIDWKHDLLLAVPENVQPRQALLFIGGGAGSDEAGLRALAQRLRAPVAALQQVPNQPLLDGLYEDDLIAETFVRFLRTGEEDWPLLLPMTKSVTRAMDALQALSRERLGEEIGQFVLSGASKRGWTAWLAAAVDPRVAGVVPRVIDMLDVPAQLPHQLASWGRYSEMLSPYTQPGLPQFVQTPPGQRLIALVDPWSYRARLTMPKLIVLGTNDRYWTLDALNLYWDGLPGEKRVRYVPNAGHNLGSRDGWIDSLTCFFTHVRADEVLPMVEAETEARDDAVHLRATTDRSAVRATLWHAQAPTRDFREAHWNAQPMQTAQGNTYVADAPRASETWTAAFAALEFDLDGTACTLSSQVTILPPAR